MADYSIATDSVPRFGRAVANINTLDNNSSSDVTTVRAVWKDHLGVTLSDETWSGSDITDVDIYGNAVTLTDPSGTGTYQATLVADGTSQYTIPAGGLTWSLTVTITLGSATATRAYQFTVLPGTLEISLDDSDIATAAMRQSGYISTHQIVIGANGVAGSGASYLSLGAGIIYAIRAAYLNGSAITNGTEFTWNLYQPSVTLATPAATGEVYTFQLQTIADAEVADIITRHKQYVLSCLQPHYPDESIVSSPTYTEIVRAMTVGQLLMNRAKGEAMGAADFRTGYEIKKDAEMQVLRIKRGQDNLLDAGLTNLERGRYSQMGSNAPLDGSLDTQADVIDAGQAYTGLYIMLVE